LASRRIALGWCWPKRRSPWPWRKPSAVDALTRPMPLTMAPAMAATMAPAARRALSDPTTRHSYRVRFPGGRGHSLAAIVDAPGHRDEIAAAQPARPVVLFSHCFTCNKDLKAVVRLS